MERSGTAAACARLGACEVTTKTPTFGLVGAAGYIAPRHMAAIKAVGGELVWAVDPHDAVGVLDRHWSHAEFYDSLAAAFKESETLPDYVSICTPNFTHCGLVEYALSKGCDVLCEKPLVLSLDELERVLRGERLHERRVWTVFQLRLLPQVIELRRRVQTGFVAQEVDIVYDTYRGPWFRKAWKGDRRLSGGILFNIGIHFLDLLTWVFGTPATDVRLIQNDPEACPEAASMVGCCRLPGASRVTWRLSTSNPVTNRSMMVDRHPVIFDGVEGLHEQIYRNLIAGDGDRASEAHEAIELATRFMELA